MAVITDIVDRMRSILIETFERRAAGEDIIQVAVSLAEVPDGSEEDTLMVLKAFISLTSMEDPDATICSLQVPCRALIGDGTMFEVADTMWDRMQTRRMTRGLGDLDLDEDSLRGLDDPR